MVAARQEVGQMDAAGVAVRQLKEWWQDNASVAQQACRLLPVDQAERLPELEWSPQLINPLAESLELFEATQTPACEIVIEVTKGEIDGGASERNPLP